MIISTKLGTGSRLLPLEGSLDRGNTPRDRVENGVKENIV